VDLGLSNKRALVTGASRGLGKAVAAALRAEGAAVAICARDAARIEAAAKEIGAVGFAADLSAPGGAEAALRHATGKLGGIDILVVNTGGPPAGTFDVVSDDAWRRAFEGLWISSVQLIRGCLPGMRERRFGRILIVTSISAREALANLTISNALRPGLHGLINALSREVAADGITVNALMRGGRRCHCQGNSRRPRWAAGRVRGAGGVSGLGAGRLYLRAGDRGRRRLSPVDLRVGCPSKHTNR